MAEYIDREAAIKSICHEKCRTEYGKCQKGKHDDKIILCVCDFLRFLPAVSVPQWISVKDRLPEEKPEPDLYLVATEDEESRLFVELDLLICGKWYNYGASVTHWMPLPEPPKGENDD